MRLPIGEEAQAHEDELWRAKLHEQRELQHRHEGYRDGTGDMDRWWLDQLRQGHIIEATDVEGLRKALAKLEGGE